MEALQALIVPIHRQGWPFIAIFGAATIGLFLLWTPLGWIGLTLTAWCAYFFRDPPRVTPARSGLIISPADGKIQSVVAAVPPAELGMGDAPRMRISIFMNIFNVHVNRAPASGTVTVRSYRPGRFLNASLDKASEDNERNCIRMTTDEGLDIAFVQIAGLVARRIVCDLDRGDSVAAGERFGIIRFGSRLDVYLAEGHTPLVSTGQIAIGGETVLAYGEDVPDKELTGE